MLRTFLSRSSRRHQFPGHVVVATLALSFAQLIVMQDEGSKLLLKYDRNRTGLGRKPVIWNLGRQDMAMPKNFHTKKLGGEAETFLVRLFGENYQDSKEKKVVPPLSLLSLPILLEGDALRISIAESA
ncbi:hypothetical protein VNO77_15431 [Canavalia gladiata]|uniref:Uncharacterized protein n=1 Tax=Canavalia gladiata TaxID=3824 RepID=A0AAN9M4C6_CANGL